MPTVRGIEDIPSIARFRRRFCSYDGALRVEKRKNALFTGKSVGCHRRYAKNKRRVRGKIKKPYHQEGTFFRGDRWHLSR